MDRRELRRERVCAIALGRIFGYEPRISAELADRLGSASKVFELSEKERDGIFGPYSKHGSALVPSAVEEAEKEYDSLLEKGYGFVARGEEDFPALLRDCPDCPAGLYVRSRSPLGNIFGREDYIAVVGTRDISPYGREWCRKIVEAIARADTRPTIVSGLAMGADITAHRTALENGLPTIAVMATGIEEIYPWRHSAAAEDMEQAPGSALVTDYPPGTSPIAINFLRRNRIIAGLSKATILIESKVKGGGMMTARLAASYGREVFALPGRLDDSRSRGCNMLISSKIAEAVFDGESLLENLGISFSRKAPGPRAEQLAEEMYSGLVERDSLCRTIRYIRTHRGCDIDTIASATRTSARTASLLCHRLENDGLISVDMLRRCTINAGL
ncbi:MAG: DNA-protecting protein DprA [Bacteroidales bacterium]|nr:DNA-protecting protein DprA [Bacteroidales bacterium]